MFVSQSLLIFSFLLAFLTFFVLFLSFPLLWGHVALLMETHSSILARKQHKRLRSLLRDTQQMGVCAETPIGDELVEEGGTCSSLPFFVLWDLA